MTNVTRTQAWGLVSWGLDNALSPREPEQAPDNAVLIGWYFRDTLAFIAVWSYLGGELDKTQAVELAVDYLQEKGWLDDPNPKQPDYVFGAND